MHGQRFRAPFEPNEEAAIFECFSLCVRPEVTIGVGHCLHRVARKRKRSQRLGGLSCDVVEAIHRLHALDDVDGDARTPHGSFDRTVDGVIVVRYHLGVKVVARLECGAGRGRSAEQRHRRDHMDTDLERRLQQPRDKHAVVAACVVVIVGDVKVEDRVQYPTHVAVVA